MRHALFVLLVLASACTHPLSKLRTEMESRNAYLSTYRPPATDTDVCRAGVKQLEKSAKNFKIDIVYMDMKGWFGLADPESRMVLIEGNTTACGKLEILAHEIAHLIQPVGLEGPEKQVFADGVSYLVVKELGDYEDIDRWATLMARYKPNGNVLTLLRREIEFAAKLMITGDLSKVDLR